MSVPVVLDVVVGSLREMQWRPTSCLARTGGSGEVRVGGEENTGIICMELNKTLVSGQNMGRLQGD